MKAIIGGTGFYDLDYLEDPHPIRVRTPFGGAKLYEGHFQGEQLYFLPRHGPEHNYLAHEVNYRANIWALHTLGVERIIGTSAVGSLNPALEVGDLVALDQLVDFSQHRRQTFNLGSVNFTEPYCPDLLATVIAQAKAEGILLHQKATYVSLEGPRYETAAEIRLWQQLGMDVVGMTNGTEAALARELGLCYAVIAIVTNMAAGIGGSQPSLEAHRQVMQENSQKLRRLALSTFKAIISERDCACAGLAARPV